MKLLVDTHAFLWFITDDAAIGRYPVRTAW